MIKVLALTGPIRESVLLDAIEQIVARKVELSVMCDFDATEYAIPDEHVEVRSLPAAIQSGEVNTRRRPRATSPSYRRWIRFHADPWFRAKSRHANLIVALDQGSVHAVWELAQRHRRPQAIYGLAPALALLDKFLGEPLPAGASVVGHVPVVGRRVVRRTRREAIATVRRAARLAVSPTVMRSRVGVSAWTALASAPGIPPNVRTKIAYRAHVNMMAAGRPQQALAATDAALVHLGKPEQRATLLAREAASEIAAGVTPSLPRALHAQLELADAARSAGHYHKAADALDAARRLLFHRMLHLDRMSSPLIDDPDAFMEPWRRSIAAMALAAPRGRSAPAAAPPTDQPDDLLLATNGNPSYLTEIRQLFEANPAVNVRVIDLAEDGRRSRLTRSIKQMMDHTLAGTTAYGHRVDEWLAPHLEWADTVFVDGCVATAAMFSMIDPGSQGDRPVAWLRGVLDLATPGGLRSRRRSRLRLRARAGSRRRPATTVGDGTNACIRDRQRDGTHSIRPPQVQRRSLHAGGRRHWKRREGSSLGNRGRPGTTADRRALSAGAGWCGAGYKNEPGRPRVLRVAHGRTRRCRGDRRGRPRWPRR